MSEKFSKKKLRMSKNCLVVPGIYHDLVLRLVSKKVIGKAANDKLTIGLYLDLEEEIYVLKELTPQARVRVFYHEISHHIRDTLATVEADETACDVLGAYLPRIIAASPSILNFLGYTGEPSEIGGGKS